MLSPTPWYSYVQEPDECQLNKFAKVQNEQISSTVPNY